MRQFFLPKSTKPLASRPIFLRLVGGLEANNYEKENFKKVIGKVLFGKKSKRIYIIPINNMKQFFLPKNTKALRPGLIFSIFLWRDS
jgi:hypothetical protein